MPYSPYASTWNNPYPTTNPYPVMPTSQPYQQQPVNGVSYPDLMRILDEQVEAISLMYPKTYEELMRKIKALR